MKFKTKKKVKITMNEKEIAAIYKVLGHMSTTDMEKYGVTRDEVNEVFGPFFDALRS